jgi:hypothetical protein
MEYQIDGGERRGGGVGNCVGHFRNPRHYSHIHQLVLVLSDHMPLNFRLIKIVSSLYSKHTKLSYTYQFCN